MPARTPQDERALEPDNVAFGAALRRAIRAAGMSERAVASTLAGTRWGNAQALQKRLNRACNGEWPLEIDLAAAVAETVGVPLDELVRAARVGGAGRTGSLTLDAAIDVDPTLSWRDKTIIKQLVEWMRAAPIEQQHSGGVLAFEAMLSAVPGLSEARKRTLARAIDQAVKDDARPSDETVKPARRRRATPSAG
jgi:hypothetical protein